MSVFEHFVDENLGSWVLVHFLDCDPGKEFEILSRTRLSVPEHVALRPMLKVKVFYGKAKLEAYVVQESDSYHELQTNFTQLTQAYTDHMLRKSIFYPKNESHQWWSSESMVYPQEPDINAKDECTILQEKYNALKVRFDDLYRIQCVLRSNMDVLRERVEVLADKAEQPSIKTEPRDNAGKKRASTQRRAKAADLDSDVEEHDDMVYFGENKTEVSREEFELINWSTCSAATRKLLVVVFGKDVLATHTLTGKPSPAFLNAGKQAKQQLDPRKTADIIQVVSRRCQVPASAVRNAITTKCADENKMCKKRKRD